MSDTPERSPENLAPLLRLGLEDDQDLPLDELDVTLTISAPTRDSAPGMGRRGWEPPGVEELQKLLPQYEVSAFIARGGMGAVYKGRQRTLKRPVAIKVLPPEIEDHDLQFAARFKHEAQAMAQLSHPNIVTVFDAGETPDGLLYFVMEFIEGTDVAQLIASEGMIEPRRAIQITTAVCEALAFAHEEGIIHRDIKPSNIMLDRKGRVKVADFGLAKTLNLEASLLTGSHTALGTPHFIAPETLIPGIKVDQRADIYAVGVMLYQMLTGHIPRGRFELPSGLVPQVDKGFDAVVDKAMQTDREKRYSNATEMKTAVEKVGDGSALGGSADISRAAAQHPEVHTDTASQELSEGPAKRSNVRAVLQLTAGFLALAAAAFFLLPKSSQHQASTAPVAEVPSTSASAVQWQDWLAESEKAGTLPPQLAKEAEGWRITQTNYGSGAYARFNASFGASPLKDVAIRVTYVPAPSEPDRQVFLAVRQDSDIRGWRVSYNIGEKEWVLNTVKNRAVSNLLAFAPVPEMLTSLKSRTVELRMVGDTLSFYYDGILGGSTRDATPAVGQISFSGVPGMLIQKVEWADLHGTAGTQPLKLTRANAAMVGPTPKAEEATVHWHDWLAEREKGGTMPPQLVKESRGWRLSAPTAGSGPYARFHASFGGPHLKDAAIRVTCIPPAGGLGKQVYLTVREIADQQGLRVRTKGAEGQWCFETVKNGTSRELLALKPIQEMATSREPRTVELRMVGETLSFFYNGSLAGEMHDSTPATGGVGFNGPPGILITKVEWADLANTGPASSAGSKPPHP